MKFSNRLLLFLAGVVFVLLGLFLFTHPVANLVAYSWWIAFVLISFNLSWLDKKRTIQFRICMVFAPLLSHF